VILTRAGGTPEKTDGHGSTDRRVHDQREGERVHNASERRTRLGVRRIFWVGKWTRNDRRPTPKLVAEKAQTDVHYRRLLHVASTAWSAFQRGGRPAATRSRDGAGYHLATSNTSTWSCEGGVAVIEVWVT